MFKRVLALAAAFGAVSVAAHAALPVGATAPDFTAQGFLAGKPFTFKLSEALKKGPVVLYFYPAAFTKGCSIEAHLFAEASDQFKADGATLIGMTAGNTDRLGEFSSDTATCSGKFPMVSDASKAVAKSYDAAGAEDAKFTSRTSFVIAKNGKVAMAYTDPKPDDHVSKTLEVLASLKAGK